MRHKVFFLFLALLAMSQTVWAYDFSAVSPSGHTLYYKVRDSIAHTVYVCHPCDTATKFPNAWTGFTKPTGNVVVPSTVTYNGISYTITMIWTAFAYCDGITNITIPSTVVRIGEGAFYGCTGLTNVSIPTQVRTLERSVFRGCVNLQTINLPDSLRTIGDYTFYSCSRLSSINLPAALTSIGNWAFRDCTGLTSVVFNADSCILAGASTYDCAFSGCSNINSFIFGNNVKVIPAYLCYDMDSLTSVTLPSGCTSIGNSAFSGCGGLTGSLTLPSSLTTIGDHAFSSCGIAGPLTIPNSVIAIGNQAFWYCRRLTSVTIPSTVTSIGQSAFYGCTSITSITSLATVAPRLGTDAFFGVSSTIDVHIPCGGLMSYYSRWSYFSNFVEAAASTLSVQSANTAMGTVSILTQPTCQAPTAVFHAVANSGFQFSHWNDLNMDNPRSVLLTQDTSFTACFTPAAHDTVFVHDTVTNTVHDTLVVTDTVTNTVHDTLVMTDTITIDRYDTIYLHDTIYIHDTLFVGGEGIGDVKTIDAKIYTRDGQIVVEGVEGMPVVLYDAVGRQLAARREEAHGGAPLRFDVPASGVYLVRIGNRTTHRVVVIR